MQAVILAAGKGTRMRPLTYEIPKPMLMVNGKPILEYTISFLPESVDEVIIVIGYLGEQIKEYFGSNFLGKKITYVFQEKLNGTGGCIQLCRSILKNNFLVLMGDDLYHKKDIEKLAQEKLAVLAYRVEDPTRFGIFKIDANNQLMEIIEKPKFSKSNLANIGAYAINQDFFNYPLVPISETEYGLPQTLTSMNKDFKIKVIPAKMWQPVGYPEDIEKAEKNLDKFLN
ncbi:MAG: glucose-1-phosphate thymidylyltransferase (strD) [Candidatus Moranbacteria bacterium CG10_big_fil_rev_8_21_14_0_10_35_21]|nr:MAG: glucose-1-phosphate thymidylyltransferase (strD) [Candidatus Moranbacteria bacterium CG10_big_fil_rev_8_21_14_0_10_35_21]PJA88889.1 MAG: glucose-1-phosphate thymidylyltransferase (strD) [Candidatus Moranbacteria bacterium CG_4_9_14_3_um_filter_36_9]